MVVLIAYFGAIGVGVGAHVALDLLRAREIVAPSRVDLLQHFLQGILLTAAAVFDLGIRPDLAVRYAGLDLAWGPRTLVHGLPYGVILFVAVFCAGVDNLRMYVGRSAGNWGTFRSCSFWAGLAFGVLVPPLATHVLTNADGLSP